jgi:hypothetical protein
MVELSDNMFDRNFPVTGSSFSSIRGYADDATDAIMGYLL